MNDHTCHKFTNVVLQTLHVMFSHWVFLFLTWFFLHVIPLCHWFEDLHIFVFSLFSLSPLQSFSLLFDLVTLRLTLHLFCFTRLSCGVLFSFLFYFFSRLCVNVTLLLSMYDSVHSLSLLLNLRAKWAEQYSTILGKSFRHPIFFILVQTLL